MRCPLILLFLATTGLAQFRATSSKAPCPARHADRPLELTVLRDVGHEGDRCEVLGLRRTQKVRGLDKNGVYTTKVQTARPGEERFRFIAHEKGLLWQAARSMCGNDLERGAGISFAADHRGNSGQEILALTSSKHSDKPPPLQIEPLIQTGPSSNRVDLVFFADGYLAEERDKFLADARRLAEDVSGNQTFNTVKPLLNFWAAFTPSKESGIGAGGKPKDTVFGLYRPGTELRGVYYSKPEVGRAACDSLGDQCDYPILMGNDPLYGGLGGEFTVITPSLANGPLVLRHELGHSIIDVGEEYDGGFGYFGVNAAQNYSAPISWAHWLSNASSDAEFKPVEYVERAVMPMQDYAWTMLNTTSAWLVKFSASGLYSRHLIRFSLSGLPEASDLSVELDGKDLEWTPRPGIGEDRWHYDIHKDGGLEDGDHQLKFTLKNPQREGAAQLCSAEVLEFGNEREFNATPGHYSLYPTFSLNNATTYRPTNEDCLMRQVTTPNFCKVCVEGLWLSLLRRVDLIDSALDSCVHDLHAKKSKRQISLNLVPLGQFRANGALAGESYTITWSKDGQVLDEFTNKTRLEIPGDEGAATYSVDVKFATEEVRVDKDGLLLAHQDFGTRRCSVVD